MTMSAAAMIDAANDDHVYRGTAPSVRQDYGARLTLRTHNIYTRSKHPSHG